MHLSPRELDKLVLHQAGFVAQKRLARGLRLNQPESVALIATQLLEFIREGRRVTELMNLGRQLLGRNQVMGGVPEMITEIQVEGTFPDGTKLVTVHHPIALADGRLDLALHGSFLPVPDLSLFGVLSTAAAGGSSEPGEVICADESLEMNAEREVATVVVVNRGDRPVQVGSHYHFIEVNPLLEFDRAVAFGKRLDIPAGTAVRFEPGETKTVRLVAIGGRQVIRGGNNLVDGPVTPENLAIALDRIQSQGFAHKPHA